MELWDVLTDSGVPTGKKIKRGGYVLKSGEYHLVVHIWPVSKDGAFLIQRRSFKKKLMPGEWAATGGAAMAGEDSFTAAKRELKEELGLEPEIKFIKRIKRRNSFIDIWGAEVKCTVDSLKLQKSEVACAKWVSAQTLEKMVKKGEFHNYGRDYFNIIFNFAKSIKLNKKNQQNKKEVKV